MHERLMRGKRRVEEGSSSWCSVRKLFEIWSMLGLLGGRTEEVQRKREETRETYTYSPTHQKEWYVNQVQYYVTMPKI